MKTVIRTAALSTCLIMFIVSGAISQSNQDLKSKIESLNKEMGQAMISGNTEKSLSFYTKDAISMPEHGKMLEGLDAIRKSNEEMMKSGSKVTAFETSTKKIIPSDKTIIEIGNYKITFSVPGKPEPMNDNGKYMTVWEKQSDGSLKVKVEIWNSDINPQGKDMM